MNNTVFKIKYEQFSHACEEVKILIRMNIKDDAYTTEHAIEAVVSDMNQFPAWSRLSLKRELKRMGYVAGFEKQ